MSTSPIPEYLKQIEKTFGAGNATEHSYRPALKILIEALADQISATNEPQRERCGAPDFIVTKHETPIGYIETKDLDKPLDLIEKDEQLKRYRQGLHNLILTDYLEFRWYVWGELRLTARLSRPDAKGKIRAIKAGEKETATLLHEFLHSRIATIGNPKELAVRMAALAKLLRDTIRNIFADEDPSGVLHEQMEGFRKVLLHDLTEEQFADMYAQTIAYGLFAARCNTKTEGHFIREHAAYELPKTNPFLRKMFTHIAGPDMEDRLVWIVEDLTAVLDRADMPAILKDFGKATRREDPVVHFYETFLAAYNPKVRETRGVYYTPEPVVSYIVRSVDHVLKTSFGLESGLADASKIAMPGKNDGETEEIHKVLILDPATGTGTFLHEVIHQIYETVCARGQKGAWAGENGYVSAHLLPRLFGFELLMAPYAVAHMKLGLLLDRTGYDFGSDERLRIYLTNTLEEAFRLGNLPLFARWLADEVGAAGEVKKNLPVMVVLGNPPYSGHSANTGAWIFHLLRGKNIQTDETTENYFTVDGQPLGEKNPKWLNDDYVKFIRF
ncbi:MAG TPA: N-6 DNA methylase, partial [Syntrophales bacterium]|nr:N-6 DNA methylase [Syntrophales bacterium]